MSKRTSRWPPTIIRDHDQPNLWRGAGPAGSETDAKRDAELFVDAPDTVKRLKEVQKDLKALRRDRDELKHANDVHHRELCAALTREVEKNEALIKARDAIKSLWPEDEGELVDLAFSALEAINSVIGQEDESEETP